MRVEYDERREEGKLGTRRLGFDSVSSKQAYWAGKAKQSEVGRYCKASRKASKQATGMLYRGFSSLA